jgi:hypothetical protein
MRKLKGDNWNKYAKKMSQKINKIMDEETTKDFNVDEEYKLIQERKSKLSANMREAITYQFHNKNAKKD